MTAATKSFGEFTDPARLTDAIHSGLKIDAVDLKAFWRRCSMTADFWARFASLAVPTPASPGWLNRDAAFHVLAYLLNELFENCAKFTTGPTTQIEFDLWTLDEDFVCQAANPVGTDNVQAFIDVIEELLSSDLEELYFQKLEANAESGEGGSGLGYLTMMKDYGVRFGFAFQPLGPESVLVQVQALVSKKEI